MLAIKLGRNQSFTLHEPISVVFTLKVINPGVSATFYIQPTAVSRTIHKGVDYRFEYAPGLFGTICLLNFMPSGSDGHITKVSIGIKLPKAIKVTF